MTELRWISDQVLLVDVSGISESLLIVCCTPVAREVDEGHTEMKAIDVGVVDAGRFAYAHVEDCDADYSSWQDIWPNTAMVLIQLTDDVDSLEQDEKEQTSSSLADAAAVHLEGISVGVNASQPATGSLMPERGAGE